MLEAYAASKRDLDAVLSIEPKNSSARRELAVVHKYIEQVRTLCTVALYTPLQVLLSKLCGSVSNISFLVGMIAL